MGQAAFRDQPFLTSEDFCKISCAAFWTKKVHKYKKILNNSLSQNKD